MFVGWPSSFYAQAQTLPFQHLFLGKGQDVNFAYEILQDRQGFIWFGTFDGIVRYGGHRFKHCPFDPEAMHPMKGKRINGLLELPIGNIWMVSGNRLLAYHPERDSFHAINSLGATR